MTKVKPEKGRANIKEDMGSLEIEIPSKKNFFILSFLTFWLCGWTVGGCTAFETVLSSFKSGKFDQLFLIAWLGGWAVGECVAGYILLWGLVGKEIIKINSRELSYKRDLFGIGRTKEFDLTLIQDLRTSDSGGGFWGSRASMEFWGTSGGTITFDYGVKTYKMGAGLYEAEAKQIIEKINANFPALRKQTFSGIKT